MWKMRGYAPRHHLPITNPAYHWKLPRQHEIKDKVALAVRRVVELSLCKRDIIHAIELLLLPVQCFCAHQSQYEAIT